MNSIIDGLCSKYMLEDVEDIVALLHKKYNIVNPVSDSKPISENKAKTEPVINRNVVLVNEDYILKLYQNTESLKGIISDRDYNGFCDKLNDIIDNDDYDDPEEVMSEIHNAIDKYIYGSFVKIASEKVKILKDYILKADYKKIGPFKTIKNGNARYYESMFPEMVNDAELDGKIKTINKEPYVITYLNDESEEEFVLRGSCVYYKYKV